MIRRVLPSRAERAWAVATALTVLVAVLLGAVIAPPDAVQGQAQRLMYLHVPAAWGAYLCFFLVLVASGIHLRTRARPADRVARAAAECGVVLTGCTLLTGSVWGAMTWGTWWAWDARVSTTVTMGLVYVGHLAVRGLVTGPRGATLTSITGVAGFAVVPLVHFSVLWWRTLHQPPTVLAPSLEPPLDGRMAAALAVSVLAVTMLTVWALYRRTSALTTVPTPVHGRSAVRGVDRVPS
jgi:heme exporter protein C